MLHDVVDSCLYTSDGIRMMLVLSKNVPTMSLRLRRLVFPLFPILKQRRMNPRWLYVCHARVNSVVISARSATNTDHVYIYNNIARRVNAYVHFVSVQQKLKIEKGIAFESVILDKTERAAPVWKSEYFTFFNLFLNLIYLFFENESMVVQKTKPYCSKTNIKMLFTKCLFSYFVIVHLLT